MVTMMLVIDYTVMLLIVSIVCCSDIAESIVNPTLSMNEVVVPELLAIVGTVLNLEARVNDGGITLSSDERATVEWVYYDGSIGDKVATTPEVTISDHEYFVAAQVAIPDTFKYDYFEAATRHYVSRTVYFCQYDLTMIIGLF